MLLNFYIYKDYGVLEVSIIAGRDLVGMDRNGIYTVHVHNAYVRIHVQSIHNNVQFKHFHISRVFSIQACI